MAKLVKSFFKDKKAIMYSIITLGTGFVGWLLFEIFLFKFTKLIFTCIVLAGFCISIENIIVQAFVLRYTREVNKIEKNKRNMEYDDIKQKNVFICFPSSLEIKNISKKCRYMSLMVIVPFIFFIAQIVYILSTNAELNNILVLELVLSVVFININIHLEGRYSFLKLIDKNGEQLNKFNSHPLLHKYSMISYSMASVAVIVVSWVSIFVEGLRKQWIAICSVFFVLIISLIFGTQLLIKEENKNNKGEKT